MTVRLDFSDPQIQRMVELGHWPDEKWNRLMSGQSELLSVYCDQCGHDWPCPTILSLRAWKEENLP